MRTPVKKLVSAVATSIAVMGAGQAAAEIKIGIAGPMTGPVAQYGDMQFSGARMAIEQISVVSVKTNTDRNMTRSSQR